MKSRPALAAASTAVALAAPAAAAQPGPPTWPTSPQPITGCPVISDSQPENWIPTETQIRSALAQEHYYMSFGQRYHRTTRRRWHA